MQPARQHLCLDDLNGFPAVTKNVHFLSPWHSPAQPPDTIDFFFFPPTSLSPPLPCTQSHLVFCSRVSESEVQVRRQERNKQAGVCFMMCTGCVCLSAGVAASLMAEPRPALWNVSVWAPDYGCKEAGCSRWNCFTWMSQMYPRTHQCRGENAGR